MFGIAATDAIPEEYIHGYEAWDGYMSDVWAGLLQIIDIKPDSRVIEIAPGASTKIAAALSKINFAGEVVIIEPFAEAAAIIALKYEELIPNAKIRIMHKSLRESLADLHGEADTILSNHPLDDMLISQAANYDENNALFGWSNKPKDQLSDSFITTWKELCTYPDIISKHQKAVVEEWHGAIRTLNPKNVIISQYASLVLHRHGLNAANGYAKDILKELKQLFQARLVENTLVQHRLNSYNNFNDTQIGTEILDARNWMVIK